MQKKGALHNIAIIIVVVIDNVIVVLQDETLAIRVVFLLLCRFALHLG